jgi:Protein of unknown function (DUF402)
VVALRHLNAGRVSYVWPMIVVSDADDEIALFIGRGTPTRRRVALDGVPIERSLGYAERNRIPWRLGYGEWFGSSVVQLARPGEPYSYWAFYEPETWAFEGWYVNLQEPLRRTAFGFDTVDHVLDLVIARDLSSWRWKDDDELEDAVRVGRFTAAEAAEIREHGERAVAALDARAWPFDRGWDEWRPDRRWRAPALRDEWSRPEAAVR